MKVNCIEKQASLFEMRFLKRVTEPVFIPADALREHQSAPLVLFGKWHEAGITAGLNWLLDKTHDLKFPCILFPPFTPGSLRKELRLDVNLEVISLEKNELISLDEEISHLAGKDEFRIQADVAFSGPAGTALVVERNEDNPVVLVVQLKSTATPLVLCAANVLSASSLSDTADRFALFKALVIWAMRRESIPHAKNRDAAQIEMEVPIEFVNSIAVLLAGTNARNPEDLARLAQRIFGTSHEPEFVKNALNKLKREGLVDFSESAECSVRQELLEQHVQNLGLWAHVRILRRDIK